MFDALKKAIGGLKERVTAALKGKEEKSPAVEVREVRVEEEIEEVKGGDEGKERKDRGGREEERERKGGTGPTGEKEGKVERWKEGVEESAEGGRAGEKKAVKQVEGEGAGKGSGGEGEKGRKAKGEKLKAKVSLGKQLAALLKGEVEIEEKDIEEALEEFELSLLQAEVALPVAEELKEKLKVELVGKRVSRDRLGRVIEEKALELLSKAVEGMDFEEWLQGQGERPIVIMLFGPNGSGKTTTAAKLAHFLKGKGLKVLLIAADTFRAASIEQLKEHGKRIGVDVFEMGYNVKPSAVIYKGLEKARREGYDVAIVDTAGRQEVNVNLMKELEKMVRVAKPHLKLYVVEAIGGNAVFEQVKSYNSIVGIDGLIITKLDLDERGGALLSASHTAKAPVVFVSMGQGYGELRPYSQRLVEEILYGNSG